MTNELFIIVTPPICAAVGYLGKYFVDKIEAAKEGRKATKLKTIENKLKHFFYPFSSNLKRENIIFKRILSFFKEQTNNNSNNTSSKNANELYMKIFWGLDTEILKIHDENQELIKNNFIEMHFSTEIANLIAKYDEYVSIYRILRRVIPEYEYENNIDNVLWPDKFGSSYPSNLLKKIENEMIHLQNQQTYILQGNNLDSTYNHLKKFQYRKISSDATQQHISENNYNMGTKIDVEIDNNNGNNNNNIV